MKNNTDFDIHHRWQLETRPDELTAIVLDTTCYPKWCARILMNCEIVNEGATDGLGLSLRVHTKGWLPYSFLFTATIIDLVPHQRMTVAVSGDFVGYGFIEIDRTDDQHCDLNINWLVDVQHPQLKPLVWLLYPVMKRNHIWAVNWVKRMFQAEVYRRRAGLAEFQAPKPTFGSFLSVARRLHNKRAHQMGWRSDV